MLRWSRPWPISRTGTRQNIDEFTKTTSTALREIGGATKSKAIIILNPAEPHLDAQHGLCRSARDQTMKPSSILFTKWSMKSRATSPATG